MDSKLGHWAFIVGVLLAVIAGLVPALQTPFITWILVLLGIVIGVMNINAKEQERFLVAVVALVLVSSAFSSTQPGNIGTILGIVQNITSNVLAFTAPAAFVVAIKVIYELAVD